MFITVAPVDRISDSGLLMFATGDAKQCHTVQIVDNICENESEEFLSNLTLASGVSRIIVDPDSARVIINDTDDCGKCVSVGLLTLAVHVQRG